MLRGETLRRRTFVERSDRWRDALVVVVTDAAVCGETATTGVALVGASDGVGAAATRSPRASVTSAGPSSGRGSGRKPGARPDAASHSDAEATTPAAIRPTLNPTLNLPMVEIIARVGRNGKEFE